jgi:L-ornithine N5-oxygenase
MSQQVYSVLGVGFGPANLSLAVALDERDSIGRARFIERADRFQWQDEQLLPGADIQNNPFRDLVMSANPISRHTFVNYLATHGKLTGYLHLNLKFPLRREYAGYLGWVAEAFGSVVDYGQSAARVSVTEHGDTELFCVETESGRSYLGEHLVVGTGRSPRIPPELALHLGPTVFHSTAYLSSIGQLGHADLRVVVVGASQSAIEIVLDLLGRPNIKQVTSIHRGIGFRLKDTSPYSRQVFLPEFVDYFHPLPSETRRRLRAELRSIIYGASDLDVIDRLAGVQHEYELTGSDRLRLMPFSEVQEVGHASQPGTHRLVVQDINYKTKDLVEADVVILATGFRDFGTGVGDEHYHPLLDGVAERLTLDDEGLPVVARDYSVEVKGRHGPLPLYLNGLCEASHGMGDAGALAMLSARATDITESIMGQPGGIGPEQPLAVEAFR